MSGGPGREDMVTYASRTAPVFVSAGSVADDGAAGEGDNVRPDVEEIYGGAGDDVIRGTELSAALAGNGGNDWLVGGAGTDTLIGGEGDDRLDGGGGDDHLSGDEGIDTVDYSSRTELVTFTLDDEIYPGSVTTGGAGGVAGERDEVMQIENVTGGSGDDVLAGNLPANVLDGGPGNDTLRGGEGDDVLIGGPGDDRLDGEDGNDSFDGGTGTDRIIDPPNSAAVVDGVLRVNGTGADETILITRSGTGSGASLTVRRSGARDDTLPVAAVTSIWVDGMGGNDTLRMGNADGSATPAIPARLSGAKGDDVLMGGLGADTLSGGEGNDRMDGGPAADTFIGGGGDADTIDYSRRTADLLVLLHPGYALWDGGNGEAGEGDVVRDDVEIGIGGSGNDRMAGGDGTTVYGGPGDDDLRQGWRGENLGLSAALFGGPGNDKLSSEDWASGPLSGEEGDDYVYLQDYSSVTVSGGSGHDTLRFQEVADYGFDFDATGTSFEVIWASARDDRIVSDADTELIRGNLGNDVIIGGPEGNTLLGEEGDDQIFGGGGNDRIDGGSEDDRLYGDNGDDFLSDGDGDDELRGGAGDDTLYDADGTNILDGGPGLDTVNGVRETGDVPVYQAEAATVVSAKVAADHAGYTGAGYVDFVNAAGDYVEWSLTVPSTGAYRLQFRYANGGSKDRPLQLRVNGLALSPTVPFEPTGGWRNWSTVSVTATLAAGVNNVRLTAAGASGPNIDLLNVVPDDH